MQTKTPAYQRLANEVIQHITSGKWSPGDKMPSLRQFSRQHNTSLTTAIRCYDLLQDHGYVVSKARSGFIIQTTPVNTGKVLNAANKISSSEASTPAFSPQVRTHFSTLDLLTPPATYQAVTKPFFGAQIAPKLLPTTLLNRCISRMHKYNQGFSYGDPVGELELREQITQHFSQQGFALSIERLLVTNGCMDAVSQALEVLTTQGDIIAVNSPCYHGLLQLLQVMQRKVIEIPSTLSGLDIEALGRAAQQHDIKACIFSSNHQNPSGYTLPIEQKQWLAEFANRQKIPLIEDDVFIDLNHKGFMPLPIKHWDTHGYVVWCSSVAKTLAPGLRLGWCDGGRFIESLQTARRLKSLGVNRPLQQGLAEFFRNGHYRRYLARFNPKLGQQVMNYRQYLAEHLPPHSHISTPSGGSTLWVQVPNLNAEKLAAETQGKDWAVISGHHFSSRQVYQDHFRLNAGWPLTDDVKSKLQPLLRAIEQSIG